MTLPAPILDDRTYDQLLEELKSRVGVYLPEWTDLGPSDPGVTMLELVAHLGESLLYRFNQIPDQTRLWLLRLLEKQPHPPRQASGLVCFDQVGGMIAPPEVPRGTSVLAGALPFRVENDVLVLPLTTTTVIKARTEPPTDPLLLDEYQRILDAADLDATQAQPYEEAVLGADPSAPGFTALDGGTSIDRQLWIAVRPTLTDPAQVAAARSQLLGAASPLVRAPLTLGFALDADFPEMEAVEACEQPGGASEPERRRQQAGWTPAQGGPASAADSTRSTLVWQVTLRSATDPTRTEYATVTVVGDTTHGLRRNGTVSLLLPPDRLGDVGTAVPEDADLAGVGDEPPALADAQPVLFWVRVFAREGAYPVRGLRWVGLNAADVTQRASARAALLGIGTGLSHQEYQLAQTPAIPGTLRVDTFEEDSWISWHVVETFAGSTPADRHVMVDGESGTVRCGDGVRGRAFPVGAQVRARSYDYGGGRAGLVASGAIALAPDLPVLVRNPLPTVGGQDGESITSALARIPGELSRQDRAVTAEDFEAHATQVAGVSRAVCLPRFDPTTKALDAAGVVTVMVWPTEDVQHPDAPRPDTTLLGAVCARLDRRRLVTTELFVIPPRYRPIAVSVGLGVKQGYSALGVRRWVELVLRQYLSPVPPFGPDGQGWPLGHRVYPPELEAAAVQVEGVDFVTDLRLADLRSGSPVAGPVDLLPWEVPALTEITVVQGEPPEPGAGPVEPAPGPAPVPVPVPRDEC